MPADIMAAARAPFKVQGRRYQMVGAKQHAAGWAEAFRLRDAAERGDKPAVALLLAAGADVNGYSGKTRWTALHAAADRGRLEVVGLLLSFGADLTLRTTAGATALKLACSAGRVACATELLAAGADPNGCPGPTGQTALHTALRTGHVETIRVLVQSGADPDLPRQPVPAGHLPMTARQMAESRVGALALPTSTDFKLTSAKVMRDPSYLSMADVAVNYGRELDDGLLPSLAPSIYAADFAAPPPVPAGPPHMPGGGEEQEDGEVGGQVGVGGGEDIFSMKVAEEAAAAEAERDLAEAEANAEEARQQMLAEEQADAAKLEALRKAEFDSQRAASQQRAAALVEQLGFAPDEEELRLQREGREAEERRWQAATIKAARAEAGAEGPPVPLNQGLSIEERREELANAEQPGARVAASAVIVKGDTVTLATAAPTLFCLKPGRLGVVIAVADDSRTPFTVRAIDSGRTGYYCKGHLEHAAADLYRL